jgi:pimeloyl-ACP methyl ester carboxylesterase
MYGDPNHFQDGSLAKYVDSLRVPGTVDYVLDILRAWSDDMAALSRSLEHTCHIPALLLWGDRDRAVSLESARNLRQCFDRVEFELLPGTGHLPYEECPETLARLVNAFLVRMRQIETGPQLVRNNAHARQSNPTKE